MKRASLILLAILMSASLAVAQGGAAPAAGANSELKQKVEAQVRKLYALGPTFTVKAGEPADSPVAGLQKIDVEVGIEGQTDTATFYVTRDGRFIIRGEIFDSTVDPFAVNRALIKTEGAPSKGPAAAKVTVVEYSDFQCPQCRQLHNTLRAIVPLYPNVRFVFKDFPLEQIHPWAMTAHQAAYCARQQKPDSFWKIHDMIFDKQEVISATTAWETFLHYGSQLGLDTAAMKSCMADGSTTEAIQRLVQEGLALKVANTPTVFVNGRRLVGGDRQSLEQFIQFELAVAGGSIAAPPAKRQ
jgi:protein-disulfide isomerase